MTNHSENQSNETSRVPHALPRKTQIAIILGIILMGGAAWLALHYMAAAPVPPAGRTAPPGTFLPTKSQLDGLKIASVQSMSFRGEQVTDGVIAYNDDTTTPVFSPYSGQVTRVIAQLGSVVKKGDPLMTVAAAEFVQARSDLVTAHAQVTLVSTNEKRLHELYDLKAVAQKDWQQSQSDLATAESNLRAAQNRLRILGKSDQEISMIETEGNGAKMNPDALVLAPVSGTIIQRQVGLGQYIQSAATGANNPVYTIGNLSTVYLIANVREGDAPLMHVGQPVEVRVLALPERVFKAQITWVAPAIDPNTHRLPVRAEIANSDGALKPMMFANFNIVTRDEVKSIGIPQSAVVYEGSEAHVFVANADGSVAIRPIHVGNTSGNMLEVVSGLVAGDKIVTSGSLFIDRAAEGSEQ
jgi:cobalt-zinc-cadmium efflux system membrane fusion protein